MSIGSRLKQLRESKGYNKREIAEKLEMPYTTYNNYETDARDVGSETLRKIAQFYEVTIDYLLENDLSYLESSDTPGHFLDPEAAELAQEMYDRPELKTLFSTTRNVSKEDLEVVQQIVDRIAKAKNGPDDDPA